MTLNKEQKLSAQASTAKTNPGPRSIRGNLPSPKSWALCEHEHYVISPVSSKLPLPICLLDTAPRISPQCRYLHMAKSLCPDLFLLNSHHLLSYMTLLSISLFKQETQKSVFIPHLISYRHSSSSTKYIPNP